MRLNSSKSEAEKLFDKGRYRTLIKKCAGLLIKDEKDITALFYLALGLYYLGQLRRSLQYWKRLKKISPKELNLHLNMGCAWQDLRRNDLAIRCYKHELKLNQLSGETLYSLGTLYFRSHKYKLAAVYLERCYWLDHSADEIIDRLAHAYFKMDQVEKEAALYEHWLQRNPADSWCLNNLGAALMHLGEYSRAQLILQRAQTAAPKDQMVVRNLNKARKMREIQKVAMSHT